MKKISTTILVCAAILQGWSQSAYVFPSPTAADEEMTLFIDVSQTNSGLKSMLEAHPEEVDNVYLWSWMPAEPVGGNGTWAASNESRKLTHVSGLLFSVTFIPVEFYGVDGPTFFSSGISCLAKLKDGNAYPDDGFGEAKTPDLHVDIVPKLCDNLYCVFPQLAKAEDYVTITYDNTQEPNVAMQGVGADECYLYFRIEQDLFTGFYYEQDQNIASTLPALKMKPVAGETGKFRLTFIPSDFFDGILPDGFDINTIKFFAIKPGVTYPVFSLPYENYSLLNCSN
ncbi:MAG: hypothetical protein ACKVOK_13370 [Flavobacteriales bacterium]